MKNTFSIGMTFICTVIVSACAGGTDNAETGGGAGDTSEASEAIALITPLVGLYDLPDNWAGLPLNEAYLEIQQPGEDGVATSLVHRLDVMNNCFEPRPSRGKVTRDLVNNRAFLDSFDFGSAVISKTDNTLLIELTEDVQDIDNDEDFDERAELTAQQLDIAVIDLGNTCQ